LQARLVAGNVMAKRLSPKERNKYEFLILSFNFIFFSYFLCFELFDISKKEVNSIEWIL